MSQCRDRKSKCCDPTALPLCSALVCRAVPFGGNYVRLRSQSDATSLIQVQFGRCGGIETRIGGIRFREGTLTGTGSSSVPSRSGAEDIVDFDRRVNLAEPFGAVGRAAAAALVEGQPELAQQARHLLAGGDMAEIGPHAERGLIDVVERSQTTREELAIDH